MSSIWPLFVAVQAERIFLSKSVKSTVDEVPLILAVVMFVLFKLNQGTWVQPTGMLAALVLAEEFVEDILLL